VLGTVVRGAQLGRTLGFPTANLAVQNEQLPREGVYAVRVMKDGIIQPGVANLGKRPTVAGNDETRLEVHLLDYNGEDFYGEELEVWFVKLLREERKFSGLDALTLQIRSDAIDARGALRS
jgi:riboflavin kinase/FMN adenylyltransferase